MISYILAALGALALVAALFLLVMGLELQSQCTPLLAVLASCSPYEQWFNASVWCLVGGICAFGLAGLTAEWIHG